MLESVLHVFVESEIYVELFESSHLAFLTATEGKTGRGCTLDPNAAVATGMIMHSDWKRSTSFDCFITYGGRSQVVYVI